MQSASSGRQSAARLRHLFTDSSAHLSELGRVQWLALVQHHANVLQAAYGVAALAAHTWTRLATHTVRPAPRGRSHLVAAALEPVLAVKQCGAVEVRSAVDRPAVPAGVPSRTAAAAMTDAPLASATPTAAATTAAAAVTSVAAATPTAAVTSVAAVTPLTPIAVGTSVAAVAVDPVAPVAPKNVVETHGASAPEATASRRSQRPAGKGSSATARKRATPGGAKPTRH